MVPSAAAACAEPAAWVTAPLPTHITLADVCRRRVPCCSSWQLQLRLSSAHSSSRYGLPLPLPVLSFNLLQLPVPYRCFCIIKDRY